MKTSDNANILSTDEVLLRLDRIRNLMKINNTDALLISDNANLFYLTGRVFTGYVYITTETIHYFIRRPIGLTGKNVVYIRKIEDLSTAITDACGSLPGTLGIEMDASSYSECSRIMKTFAGSIPTNADAIIREARSIKTPEQIRLAKESGAMQTEVYRTIPSLYREGMTDLTLQIEIEYRSRRAGCLGQFRINGSSMEIFMGNTLAGDNADNPTPYDFAMGGAGQHPSLPVGADGTKISRGMSVMVDCNGNFTGYMTDMTRVFTLGDLPEQAYAAHECSRAICRRLAEIGQPGTPAKLLYEEARGIALAAGFENNFMGHRQQAGFVGHGVGIEINEAPVIAPRSRDILQAGNIIALEPKFVIPGVGAVGIENTYLVGDSGEPMQCLTNAPEEILPFIS